MSKTIEGIPEFITVDQYLGLFAACGIDPKEVVELRMAADGVHALVFALDEHGERRVEWNSGGRYKHRIFIPVRREPNDRRTSRVRDVEPGSREVKGEAHDGGRLRFDPRQAG